MENTQTTTTTNVNETVKLAEDAVLMLNDQFPNPNVQSMTKAQIPFFKVVASVEQVLQGVESQQPDTA